MQLPSGVRFVPLDPHPDHRGTFAELHRSSWGVGIEPSQWNAAASVAGTLRGVHCHLLHADYVTVVAGRMLLGLRDLRPPSATFGCTTMVTIAAFSSGVVVPPGVAHGFYFPEASVHVYAVSHDWDETDELGCAWDDPGLGFTWPCTSPRLSARDAQAPALNVLEAAVRAALGPAGT